MVKIELQIKARLENIEEFKPSDENFRWYLKFMCSNCGNVSDKWNYVSLTDSAPAPKGSAVFNFTNKCKFCFRTNSMSILEDSLKSYTADDEGKFKAIVAFDCRGIEPNNFSPREGWMAKARDGGKQFFEVDLSEGEWVDYCENINQPVTIMDIEHIFHRIK